MSEERRPGDSNAITRRYLDSLLLETRYIDSREASTACTLFGETFEMPVMTAALSHLNTFARPGGMRELAQGARDAGTVMWMGMAELTEVEECADTGARIIEIIKPYADRDQMYLRIQQAADLGLLAVGVDIDFVYDQRGNEKNFHGNPLREITSAELQELSEFARARNLPFIVKGILSTSDAKKAAAAGAGGLVLSYHGNSLEYAVPPLAMLPDVVKQPETRGIPCFADCEIQSGYDAYKAIALGAAGVCVGRPLIGAIKENGAAGVAEYLKTAAAQLKKVMVSTGCEKLEDISEEVIHRMNI